MTKTALKPALQHEEDAIALLTEDHKKVKNYQSGGTGTGTANSDKNEIQPK